MIIDKVKPFWTDEDRARLLELEQEQDRLVSKMTQTRIEESKGSTDLLEEYGKLEEQALTLKREVEDRYIKATSKKGILEDVEEIVSNIEKEDFLDYIRYRLNVIANLKAEHTPAKALEGLNVYARESYENCYWFILSYLRVQLNALANDEARTAKAENTVRKKVALWYIEETPAYLPMAHGKATDALAYMNNKNATLDKITGNATINKFDVELVILKLRSLKATLGISTDKLLSTAIATFTKQNDFRHEKINPNIAIDLKRYASLIGYDVEEHATNTPEEAEIEKKRAKIQLDNARRAIKKDLGILQATTLTWKEKVKGQPKDFLSVSLVSAVGIINGQILISFSPAIAQYLSDKSLITQYPVKLLSLDSRKQTAYYIGRKLAEYYNLDNNIINGTNDRISIPALLTVSDLPSYEEVQKKDRGHWADRIKEPFENALDTLTKEGILKNWEYTHAKGIPLTDEEASNITSYDTFSKLYLHFKPTETVYHVDRIGARIEAQAEAKTARKKKDNNKKNKK